MKIAIVQETIDPRRGGAETSTIEMARALAGLGAEVTILSIDCWPFRDPAPERLRVVALSARATVLWRKRARTAAYLDLVDAHVRVHEYDVVHAVTPFVEADVYQPRGGTYLETIARSVAIGGGRLGKVFRRFSRWFNFRQQYLLSVERRLLRRPNPPLVAALSQYVRRHVVAGYPGFPANRVEVVFNGVDLKPLDATAAAAARASLRASMSLTQAEPLILFVAHNFRLKGLRELIRAAASPQGRAAKWKLLIAGRDERGPYQRLAARLGLSDRVHWRKDGDIRDAYAAADVLAHPTWYDPCSRVVLEALANGLPVVTTMWNGASDVIEIGRTGLVIDDPSDVDRLSGAITEVLRPEFRAKCSACAAELRERVTMKRHAEGLLALYSRVGPRSA